MVRKVWTGLLLAVAVGCGEAELEVGVSEAPEVAAGDARENALRASTEFDGLFREAGAEFDVPPELLKAVAWAETRYEMVQGEPEHEGQPVRAGLMALWGPALDDGARLAGVSVEQASADARSNVRAAAAWLDALATAAQIDRRSADGWASVLERYSGLEHPEARRAYARQEVLRAVEQGLGALSEEAATKGRVLRLAPPADDALSVTQALSAGPDYAPAIWRASPNFSSRNGTTPKLIVIHTCEGAYSGCWGWLTQSAAKVSAHYVVSTTGEVSQLVREADRAWHVSASYSCGLNGNTECGLNGRSTNDFSIGIEHAGFASQSSFPAAQLEASARLICDISRDRGIPRDRFHIVAHGKLQPGNRVDPGPNWPWTSYLQRANELCGSASTPPPVNPPVDPPPPAPSGALIIDSNNARNDQSKGYIEVSSSWTSSTATAGYFGTGYWYGRTAPVSDGATFFFKLDAPARLTVDAWWTAGSDRSTAAPFLAFDAQGTKVGTATIDQRLNGGAWRTLGTFDFSAGWNRVVLSRWAAEGRVVVADALRVR